MLAHVGEACAWPGTAAGAWHNYEWLLRNDSWPPSSNKTAAEGSRRNSSCTAVLRKFIHADTKLCKRKVPSTAGKDGGLTNLPSCSARDEPLLASRLANGSVLMVGDSTSAQLLWHACDAYSSRPRSFIHIDMKALNISSLKPYHHRLRSLDNHACKLPGNVALGSFSHYGATGPPYC